MIDSENQNKDMLTCLSTPGHIRKSHLDDWKCSSFLSFN